MAKEKDVLIKLGTIIGKKAKAKFKSNVEFANVSNVSEGTIRRILLGRQNITLNVLKQLCEALDIKMSDMLKEAGN